MVSRAADEDPVAPGEAIAPRTPHPALSGLLCKARPGSAEAPGCSASDGWGGPQCGLACLPPEGGLVRAEMGSPHPPHVPEDLLCAGDTVVTEAALALPLPSRLTASVGDRPSPDRDQP